MNMKSLALVALTNTCGALAFTQQSTSRIATPSSSSSLSLEVDRRQILQIPGFAALSTLTGSIALPQAANAVTPTKSSDGNLPDLPPEAVRSYLQYRIPLQIAADYYVFELQGRLADVDSWGEINQLFQVNNNKGQGQPSKIERDYTNPMRILGLSMPPDEADEMRDTQFKFERAMQTISKSVQGVRRDLPVEIDPAAARNALKGWDDGRLALNDFFAQLNGVTGFDEMKPIPPAGPDQTKEYGRSARRYNELMKKTKLCQNRGGPALSQAWGQLMISGYMQDSCGIPDLEEYFYQG
jgi:hypothetical protein